MTIKGIIILVGFLGALGGILNCTISEEFVLPRFDAENNRWRPGWIGNVLIGALTAVIIACMYGPMAQYDVISNSGVPSSLKLSELMGAVVIGMGGGNILTQLAKNQAERVSRGNLANLVSLLNENDTE